MMKDSTPLLEEHRALRERVAFVDRTSRLELLEMKGEDRLRFTNGLVTCDVLPLEPGHGTHGFVTQLKGRILADLRILALDDRLWLELPVGRGAAIREHLQKYVIVDRVEIAPVENVHALGVAGPAAGEILAGLGGDPPAEIHDHAAVQIAGTEVRLARDADLGVPAWTLFVPAEASAEVTAALVEAGARRAGLEAWDVLRVEAGRPLYGRDFDEENFPQETGLEDSVSYTKGCYLGQEVVARIHYRGGVNRHLRGLVFADAAEQGTEDGLGGRTVLDGERAAGRVTSFVRSPQHGAIGLAILHKRVEPGTRVSLEGGGTAEVVELPFS